ncbi:hypothetical protein CISIN_1g014588mg [Citrus sinensis]|uniref:ATP-grasp fold succinyl-CoA synthetase-type domain-containing protein n=1 Tax=Citrus sinensis TaxID=2711 RepID=A0A067EZ78_CITSI|nr:hypothetical protein CISIN_1g014588mg [Citrus sinensis]
MVRGLLNKLVSRSLTVAGQWQQQQLRRLNIHEYQGAELMAKYGINVPKGLAVASVDEVKKAIQDAFPDHKELVVKSQILAGGRGLGTFKSGLKGGVHIVKKEEVEDLAGKMLGQILVTKQTGPQGKIVSKVYLCEKLSLVNEMYFAIMLDRKTAGPIIIGCSKGGTSIEDLAEKYPNMIVKVPIDVFNGITDEDAAKVVDGLAPKVADRNDAIEQVKKLYKLFCESDCTLLEVSMNFYISLVLLICMSLLVGGQVELVIHLVGGSLCIVLLLLLFSLVDVLVWIFFLFWVRSIL